MPSKKSELISKFYGDNEDNVIGAKFRERVELKKLISDYLIGLGYKLKPLSNFEQRTNEVRLYSLVYGELVITLGNGVTKQSNDITTQIENATKPLQESINMLMHQLDENIRGEI